VFTKVSSERQRRLPHRGLRPRDTFQRTPEASLRTKGASATAAAAVAAAAPGDLVASPIEAHKSRSAETEQSLEDLREARAVATVLSLYPQGNYHLFLIIFLLLIKY